MGWRKCIIIWDCSTFSNNDANTFVNSIYGAQNQIQLLALILVIVGAVFTAIGLTFFCISCCNRAQYGIGVELPNAGTTQNRLNLNEFSSTD